MNALYGELQRLEEGIYRICVPYEEVYTSVFLLSSDEGLLLFDGADDCGAEKYVLPVLRGAGMRPSMIIQSHWHDDHGGGVGRIASAYGIKIGLNRLDFSDADRYVRLQDGQILMGRFEVLCLKGHTDDGVALLDLHTNTLLSADCLQVGGIGKYGVTYTDRVAYIQSVTRLKNRRLRRIIAAHDFSPYGFQAQGEGEVERYLEECVRVALTTDEDK